MNILITGATGFIGRNLVEDLAKAGNNSLFCLVRNSKKVKLLKYFGVQLIYADISKKASLAKILDKKIDVLFHCAGYVGNKNPHLLRQINVLGTKNVCELCLDLSVERLVYLSSVAVVSGNPQIPLTEDLPFSATNIYGRSKIEAEKIVLNYREKGLRAVIIRPCMVYGKNEPHMMRRILLGVKYRILPLVDGGIRKIHLAYVKNITQAMIFSLSREEFLKGAFFVADNEVFTAKEVLLIFAKALNASKPFMVNKPISNLLRRTPFLGKKLCFLDKDRVYSVERIKSLGFNPPYSASQSLFNSV